MREWGRVVFIICPLLNVRRHSVTKDQIWLSEFLEACRCVEVFGYVVFVNCLLLIARGFTITTNKLSRKLENGLISGECSCARNSSGLGGNKLSRRQGMFSSTVSVPFQDTFTIQREETQGRTSPLAVAECSCQHGLLPLYHTDLEDIAT